jgi:hypothetical protein
MPPHPSQVLLSWRLAVKLRDALDLWTGNTLRMRFTQWHRLVSRHKTLRISGATVVRHGACLVSLVAGTFQMACLQCGGSLSDWYARQPD